MRLLAEVLMWLLAALAFGVLAGAFVYYVWASFVLAYHL